ncbi:hypothetical protein GCM10011396_05590 [Undibacterium terreum]|uniref:Uncharacterized protein n=2 Tax=Undibacterium terreum TaxID=1224302 RepID=A0A916U604_9BURK|nr:hypothetical protein GCM10011396_05590 [Undibacterium terreum]
MIAEQIGQERVSAGEAHNLNSLADYSLCYGSLLMLGLLGVMALLITLGVPVYGSFGALNVFDALARLSSAIIFLFGLYALYCYLHAQGRVRLKAGARLLLLAALFWCASLSSDGAAISIPELLLWLGQVCPSCGSAL